MTEKRHVLARIGIVLLNILAPGLGLLRLGRWRMAASLYGLALAVFLFMRFGPLAPFPVWAFFILLAIAMLLIALFGSWRLSRLKNGTLPWWRRWYAIAGVALMSFGVNWFLLDERRIAYRNFYLPAEGMSPTLLKGDRLVAYMRFPKQLRRGDVVLVRYGPEDVFVKRLAGLPGDVIAMKGGQVILNGVPVAQTQVGNEKIRDVFELVPVRRLRERFPGERQEHEIYDLGESLGDDFPAQRVRPGRYFLLGDNRDRSADSRFAHDQYGLEQVGAVDVLGKAQFYSWGSSRPIGQRIQ